MRVGLYSNDILGIYVEDNMFSPCPKQNNALDQCIYWLGVAYFA